MPSYNRLVYYIFQTMNNDEDINWFINTITVKVMLHVTLNTYDKARNFVLLALSVVLTACMYTSFYKEPLYEAPICRRPKILRSLNY